MLPEKLLVGMRMTMSLANNKTGELWRRFMPRRSEIQNTVNADLLSMQVYDGLPDFSNGNQRFEKWAVVEVANGDAIPEGMETFLLRSGLYAVFHYIGSSTDTRIFHTIFGTWLPNSAYILDERPHFDVLGTLYKNADPTSEEDLWIPIKPKYERDPE